MNTNYYQHSAGKAAEEAACEHLQKQGLILLEKNYVASCGEIDLIMNDHAEYVFVEVRLRNAKNFATGLESVTRTKQRKIVKTATLYLLEKKLWNRTICRFDIIGVSQNSNGYQFDWIRNAFY